MRGACAYELAGNGDDVTCKPFHVCTLLPSGNIHSQDQTVNVAETLIWSVLECTISIMTISVPAMRPLFAKFAPSIFNIANVTEDHKKLVDRISRHLGRSGSVIQRFPSRTGSSRRTSLQRLDSKKRTSFGTDITDCTEGTWAPKEGTIAEEITEKV